MLRKGTPGEGGQVRADSFSYTPVKVGLKEVFNAWVAGETYWCLAHEHTERVPYTKPCLDWLTEGELRCPRCGPKAVPKWIGYLPLYRETDHKPILVIVHQAVFDLVSKLRYPQFVMVGRLDKVSSVFVKLSDIPLSFRTEQKQRQTAIDITPSLLTMWKLPPLERWLQRNQRHQEVARQHDTAANNLRLSVPPPTTDIEALAIDAHRKAPSSWQELQEQALRGLQRRAAEHAANGEDRPDAEGGDQ